MFFELPEPFHRVPFLDRIHGFIKGWDLPRMNDDLKAFGWALNSEYFSSIMHELRDDPSYSCLLYTSPSLVLAGLKERHALSQKNLFVMVYSLSVLLVVVNPSTQSQIALVMQ